MDDSAFERLDGEQRQLLRLLASGLLQKQVADQLGVKPVTIEKRLEKVRSLLGAARSDQAARAFAAYEAQSPPYGTSIYGSTSLPSGLLAPPEPVSAPVAEPVLREVRQPFDAPAPQSVSRLFWRRGCDENDLTFEERLFAIVSIAIATLAVSAIGILAVVALMDFLIRVSRHGG